jgi:Tol biopolymer transport system component
VWRWSAVLVAIIGVGVATGCGDAAPSDTREPSVASAPDTREPSVADARKPNAAEARALRALGTIRWGDAAQGVGWTMRADGSGLRRLTGGLFYPSLSRRHLAVIRTLSTRQSLFDLVWSPSGKHLAVRRTDDDGNSASDLLIVRLADGQTVDLGQAATAATWAPDGTRFAYVTGNFPGLLVTVKPDGDDVRVLDEIRSVNNDVAWSPDGRTIAYLRESGGLLGTHIALVSSAGGYARPLTPRDRGVQDFSPAWSSDSRWVTFSRDAGLYMTRADGTEMHLVARPGGLPAWSSDGRWLAFVGGERGDVYVVHPDGSGGLLRLTRDGVTARSLLWVPAG